MIALRDLQFAYGGSDFSLQIPTLEVAAGENVALIGASGCGKTTLLNLMAGVLTPDRGEVQVADTVVSALAEGPRRDFRIRRLGMVFQSFELLEYLSVRDNILLPTRIASGLPSAQSLHSRVRQLAERVGIADKLNRYPAQLSQGERQRVAVSRALLLEPELILADEPTGNLDPANKHVVLDLLVDYAAEHQATMITVTHDRELLDRFSRVLDFSELNRWMAT
jgi:putative ABC transport system ATP-binding protein